jgi:hypothetical protein
VEYQLVQDAQENIQESIAYLVYLDIQEQAA